MLANLIVGQLAIIGIMNREKQKREKNDPVQPIDPRTVNTASSATRQQPEVSVWNEEATPPSYPTIRARYSF